MKSDEERGAADEPRRESLLVRIDRGLARGEASVATCMLLAMIGIAFAQALLRNLTINHVDWANDLLERFKWADSFLQKGTLWLAFFGASLATHDEKHIAIDVLSKVVPRRVAMLMQAAVGIFSAVACFFLARVFFASVLNNAADVPIEYSVLEADGDVHICDASAEALGSAGLSRPDVFCGVRDVFARLGAPITTPDTALQLVVPAMFPVIGLRFFAYGLAALARAFRSPADAR